MRSAPMLIVLAVMGSVFPALASEPSAIDPGVQILGNWSCDYGSCSDEEVQFALEDGEYIYRSWLHERPSDSGCTWQMKEKDLTIACEGRGPDEAEVLRLTDDTLVLRATGTDDEAIYHRIE